MKFFRLNKTIDEMEAQLTDMSERLHEMQVTVEVQSEALTQKDVELMEFVHKLHETMGGEKRLNSEADALARLRELRGNSDTYLAIRAVIRGNYDPDAELLRRLACAVGTSQLDVDSVIRRAAQLSTALTKNAGLQYELRNAKSLIEELEEEIHGE